MRRVLVLLSLTALLIAPTALADLGSLLVGTATGLVSSAAPDGESILLLGSGQAYTYRNNHGADCAGPSQLVVEASRKAFNTEPVVTVAYGGAKSDDQGLLLPCAMGQLRQPLGYEVQGSLSGAWSAQRTVGGEVWKLQVSAPDAAGHRSVTYTLRTLQGLLEDSFQGSGADYR